MNPAQDMARSATRAAFADGAPMSHINPTPPVSCRYGAPMGRHTGPDYLETSAGRLYLQRVPIDSGGYDRGGAYWGIGAPLWYVQDQDGNSQFLRARDRVAAKAAIVADWPDARFFK